MAASPGPPPASEQRADDAQPLRAIDGRWPVFSLSPSWPVIVNIE